ncbi:Alpha/Beta hydrolase protein [Lentinula boryana]|uniref:Alpha/Beta hydrolase protein n=1 Tax=Lentinula boryana TaxID=40481 RepID=A0ABQ8QSY8_9AGAR|nr:Alpha/Beta hydrolase protein [Lentinula boryana]
MAGPVTLQQVESLLSLVDPEDPKAQAFHFVAPSLPGFAFNSSPTKSGFSAARMTSLFRQLMNVLGYKHYVGQGGDLGAFILRSIAIQQPNSCVGIHLNFIMSPPPSLMRSPLAFLWLISHTRKSKERNPNTLSYGLVDSPVGILAWIREKLISLVGPDFVWKHETVILWKMLYLIAGSVGYARIYRYSFELSQQEIFDHVISKEVAVGVGRRSSAKMVGRGIYGQKGLYSGGNMIHIGGH